MAISELGPGGHLLTAWNLADVPTPATALANLGVSSSGGWVAFPYAAGWADFGGGYQGGQYRLRFDGEVELRGLTKVTAGLTANSGVTMGTLPAGFRPAALELFGTLCNSSSAGGSCQLSITSAGVVTAVAAANVAANGWVTLSTFRFVQVN